MTLHTGDGGFSNIAGGRLASRNAVTRSRLPTANCNERITGVVNKRESRSAKPLRESTTRITPISRPARWIVAGDRDCATASAVSALSGCTGNGIRKTSPADRTSTPAATRIAPGSSPLTSTSAATSGTITPRSATAPVRSPSVGRRRGEGSPSPMVDRRQISLPACSASGVPEITRSGPSRDRSSTWSLPRISSAR